MKKLVVEVTRSHETGAFFGNVCPTCKGPVRIDYQTWEHLEHEVKCDAGHPLWVSVRGDTGTVRLPFGCDRWETVTSSNLEAVGTIRRDLVVEFKNGTYRYPGAAEELEPLLESESIGKAFHRLIRAKYEGVKLCGVIGCGRRAIGKGYCDQH